MYSVFNVDLSIQTGIMTSTVVSYKTGFVNVNYGFQPIIRGSSTVNGDSAHSNTNLARQHNYVSFYIHSIEIKYEIVRIDEYDINLYKAPICVVLFKLPYNSEEDIRSKLITNSIGGMILYSHPENVLAYDVLHLDRKVTDIHFLHCNKPFIVGPNDYVGILYYIPSDSILNGALGVISSAKVVFKPQ